MKCVAAIAGCWVALLLCSCAHHGVIAETRNHVAAEFIGSSPGGAPVRQFLGGLADNAPCHSVTWRLALLTDQNSGRPTTYDLSALYRVPAPNNPNLSQDGPKVALHGTWEIGQGAKSRPDAVVYRIHAVKPKRSLSFVKIGDHLLQLLNPDGSLAIGNGGSSYTLNRADHAETPVDSALAMSAPDMSYQISPLATGPTVFGVFEGRSPCHGISRELKMPQHAGRMKVKWRVTLYQHPETSSPTTCKVEGSLYRQGAGEGTWSVVRGAATDPSATVYHLNRGQTGPALLLLKGDDNVLFFLNQNREPLVGHADFSYTLNRVAAK